nr:piggyBac transposable element-derived protein 4-like [Onthophagus taurus]
MEPYLGKRHSLFVDNWYTSSHLFAYLHKNDTNACGTVKKNRTGMPALDHKLAKGNVQTKSSRCLLALKWQDKREVRMLTTMHDAVVIGTGKIDRETKEEKKKPHCIVDYNQYMGTVDRSDMMLSSAECVRRTVKWYKKVFFHLFDISLFNAHALYMTVTCKKITLGQFQHQVIVQILQKYHKPIHSNKPGRPKASDCDNPLRLTERHFPSLVPPTEKKKHAQKRCVVCAKHDKRSDSRYMCSKCNAGLCLIPCFENYHTIKNY